MSEKLNLARIKKFGKTFEISVDSDAALKYKKGEITDLREVLQSEQIFSDAKKGLVCPENELKQVFQTNDPLKIAERIIKEGEIQLTADHRAKEREEKIKKLIGTIHRLAIDPKTNLPIPITRIELALEQGKIRIDDKRTVEEQIDEVIAKLRPILPIRIEQIILEIEIPAQYTGQAYQFIKNNSKLLKEEWKSDGNWKINVEIPGGLQQEFIDKINAITHGDVYVIKNE